MLARSARSSELDDAQRSLDAALGVGGDDRAANARERLSARQRVKLMGSAAAHGSGGALVSLIGTFALIEHFAPAAILLVVGVTWLLRAGQPLAEALRARAAVAEGRIERIAATRYAEIDGTRLAFPAGVLDRVPHDVPRWRVYYLPWARVVIALEPADDVTRGAYR